MAEIDVDIPKKSERMLYRRTSTDQDEIGEMDFEPYEEKPCFAISKLKPSPPEQRRKYREAHIQEKKKSRVALRSSHKFYNEKTYLSKADIDKENQSKDASQNTIMHLRDNLKKLRFDESFIHQWGVFTTEPIRKDEPIIEYIGEIIRLRVVEKRQLKNESEGNNGSYIFQLEKDKCIDATHKGGLARFINHSCNPNCATQAVNFAGANHIIIYAKRNIHAYEELCYDYKMEYESKEKRIRCLCGAPNCKQWLNWSEEAEREMNYKFDGQPERKIQFRTVPEEREITPDPERSEGENFSSQCSESNFLSENGFSDNFSSQGSEINLSARLSRGNSEQFSENNTDDLSETSTKNNDNSIEKKAKRGRKKKSDVDDRTKDTDDSIYYFFDEEESENEETSKRRKKKRNKPRPKTPPRSEKNSRKNSSSIEIKEEKHAEIEQGNEIIIKKEEIFVKEEKPTPVIKQEPVNMNQPTVLPQIILYTTQTTNNYDSNQIQQSVYTNNEETPFSEIQTYPQLSYPSTQSIPPITEVIPPNPQVNPPISPMNQPIQQMNQQLPPMNLSIHEVNQSILQVNPQVLPMNQQYPQFIQMNYQYSQINQHVQPAYQQTIPTYDNNYINHPYIMNIQQNFVAPNPHQTQLGSQSNITVHTQKYTRNQNIKKDPQENGNSGI